jgi:putative mRNA 3-end processing factor
LITLTPNGLYCEAGDFYIDPWRPVSKAIITHAHADHSRPGHAAYLAHHDSEPAMRLRLGHIHFSGLAYGESIRIGRTRVSLHPAGHIYGSAQVRIEDSSGVWVITGDYKTTPDGVCAPFEPVRCDHLITECTFGLPVFNWPDQNTVMESIRMWWQELANQGRVAVIAAYSLGKAQRIINHLEDGPGKIFVHGAIANMNEALVNHGLPIVKTIPIDAGQTFDDWKGHLVVCPPAALGTSWMKRFKNAGTAVASGWMHLRGTRRRRSVDRGFVLSDHADWQGLNDAVAASGAKHVYATHGYRDTFSKWLCHLGYDAHVLEVFLDPDAQDA